MLGYVVVMITLVTGNREKQKEIETIIGFPLAIESLDLAEIQSMNLEEVAMAKAREAYQRIGRPLIVDDVSFEVEALNGFPGPLVKWWENVVGYEAMVEFVNGKSPNVRAVAMAVYTDGKQWITAIGEWKGRLTARAGLDGFGFDFYMIPEGQDQTVAELGRAFKNEYSHRALCFRDLAERLRNFS